MDEHKQKEQVRHSVDARLSGLQGDPWLVQRVLANVKGEQKVKKKISFGLMVCILLLLLSIAALAASLWHAYDIEMFKDVAIKDILPDQWQQYDVCHKVSDGYVVGGFELGDDYISPMSDEDKIVYLNESFSLVWTLSDIRLDGCLFDKVEETDNAFYFGMERRKENWIPAIMKICKDGNIIWVYEGEKNDKIKDYTVTDRNEVYCAGRNDRDATLLKINQNGGIEWVKTFDEYDMISLNSISSWDKGMIAVGQSSQGLVLVHFDESGDILSHVSYDLDEQIDALHLQKLADGRVVLVLTVSAESLSKDVTSETKYMIISPEIFK